MAEDGAEGPVLHFGEISAVHIEKGFSFIKCPDSGFENDIFVHKSIVDPSTWYVGDLVACSVEAGVNNKPQAPGPVWKLACPPKAGMDNAFGDYTGEVVEINDQGNAFVQCDEIVEQYGKRAFCHAKVMTLCQLKLHDVIAFHLHVNAQGFPQVSAPCWKICSPFASNNAQQQKTKTWHAPPREYPPAKMARTVPPPAPQQSDEFFFGRVKHVDQAKGYSLIESPDSGYERDINVRSLVAPPIVAINVDDVVAFKVKEDAGRPNAVAPLWKLVGGEDCEIAPELGMYVGRVARKVDAGNGFVESEALKKAYGGKDAFVHFNVMKACWLEIGDTISFDVVENARGQPQIQGPCWKCCSSEGIPSTAATLRPSDKEAVENMNRIQMDIDKEIAMQAALEKEMAALRDRIRKSKEREASLRAELAGGGRSGSELVQRPTDHSPGGNDDLYYVGCVKIVDVAKGFSMVECADTGYEKDVFVHKDSADPSGLSIGEYVAFPLHISAKGNPQASAPFWKLAAARKDSSEVHFGEWIGRLKDPLPNGSSFIECEALKAQYGRETYIHQNVIDMCSLTPGQLICFRLHLNQQGFPQATTPMWILGSEEKWKANLGPVRSFDGSQEGAGKGKRKHSYDENERSDKGKGKRRTSQDDLDGSYAVGWVQTVDEARGHCTVEVPGAGFDRGIFMPFTTAHNLSVGDTVFFMLQSTPKGMQASSSDVVWKLAGREPQGNVAEIGTYVGKLKEANQHGGMHVSCPELKSLHQQEAYVLKEVVEEAGFVAGETIYFDIHLNHKGLPQVTSPCWKNASPYEPKERSAAAAVSGDSDWSCPACGFSNSARNKVCGGTGPMGCKAPREEDAKKASGNLTGVHTLAKVKDIKSNSCFLQAAHPDYPQDVYAHQKTVDPQMLALGDIVFFQIHLNARNQPQAAAPLWKIMGSVPTEFDVALVGTYKGKLENTFQANGCVIVESPEVQEKFGRQAIIDADVLADSNVQPGDIIFFDVSGTNEEGTPQISSPLWKSCSAEWLAPIGTSEQIRSSLDDVVGTSASLDQMSLDEQAPPDEQQSPEETTHNSQPAAPLDPRPAREPPQSQPQSHQAEPTPPAAAPRMSAAPRDPSKTKLEQFKAEGQDASPVLGIPMRANTTGSQLKEGDIAVIYGLSSEAGKSLNDLKVTIMKVLDTGRMQVRFMPEANRPQDVRLKSANLKPAT